MQLTFISKYTFTSVFICLFLSIGTLTTVSAQGGPVDYGFSLKTALYQRFVNPVDDNESRAAGSALLNIEAVPKIWLGAGPVNLSFEGGIGIAPVAFSTKNFKGLGAVSFPVLAKVNFGGLTTMESDGMAGFGIGGGLQWTKTELFGLQQEAKDNGAVRGLYRTVLAEVSGGFGVNGFALSGFFRYGWDTDTKASHWSFGLGYDFNLPMLRKHADPDF